MKVRVGNHNQLYKMIKTSKIENIVENKEKEYINSIRFNKNLLT